MRRAPFAWLLGALLLLPSCGGEPETQEYSGKIAAVDVGAQLLTLETAGGDAIFALSDDTAVWVADEPVGLERLAVGQDVDLVARTGVDVAQLPTVSIEILDPASIESEIAELQPVAAADTATVVATDLEARTLDVETRQGPRRYHLISATRIFEGSRTLGLEHLEPGDRVAVSAKRVGDWFVPSEVEVVAAGPEPEPEPTAEAVQ